MNTRIEELGHEAWQYADRNSSDGDNRSGILYRDKLAELIIKECGIVIDELAGGQFGGATSYDLKKHFEDAK